MELFGGLASWQSRYVLGSSMSFSPTVEALVLVPCSLLGDHVRCLEHPLPNKSTREVFVALAQDELVRDDDGRRRRK
jgi:hypothetical protein